MNSLIQVITPAYNAGRFIEETIRSLQAQTYPYWTCIIVDDGSTDDTLHIARAVTEKDERFSVYTKPNEGCSAARNFGLSKSKSDAPWTIFLDADDVYETDALAILLFTAARLGVPALGTPFRPIDKDSNWLHHPTGIRLDSFPRWMDPHIEEYSLERLKGDLGVVGVPAGWIFRTDWITMLNGYDETFSGAEDMDLLFRIAEKTPLFVMCTHTVRYRRYPEQMTQNTAVVSQGADRMKQKHGDFIGREG